jgi:hypothetical protein
MYGSALVLCGYETWYLNKREEQTLKALENRVLRRIFKLKRIEMVGLWGKLHNEELQNLCSVPNIFRMFKS